MFSSSFPLRYPPDLFNRWLEQARASTLSASNTEVVKEPPSSHIGRLFQNAAPYLAPSCHLGYYVQHGHKENKVSFKEFQQWCEKFSAAQTETSTTAPALLRQRVQPPLETIEEDALSQTQSSDQCEFDPDHD